MPGCEISAFLESLCHDVSEPIGRSVFTYELSVYLGVYILGLGSPSYLVWSVCRTGGLWTLCGFCIQDLWSLNSECEFSEMFRGLCQRVRSISWLESLFLSALVG